MIHNPINLQVSKNGQPIITNDSVVIFGIPIRNLSQTCAIELIWKTIEEAGDICHPIYIVNAYTLNLAASSKLYARILKKGSFVLGEGTGVRWAARLRGIRLKANLVGTDLMPRLLQETPRQGNRYFMLGADKITIRNAVNHCRRRFTKWTLAGYHHGYFNSSEENDVVKMINSAQVHLLLVAMGNPKQEIWIHRNRNKLHVPVAIGVGGLFDHWGGNLRRASLPVRKHGCEWIQILLQQPHKWRRYILGVPLFLHRMIRFRYNDIYKVL